MKKYRIILPAIFSISELEEIYLVMKKIKLFLSELKKDPTIIL